MTTLLVYIGLFLSCQLAPALFLWLGARWAKVPNVRFRRAIGVNFVAWLVSVVIVYFIVALLPGVIESELLRFGIAILCYLVVVVWVIKVLFRTSFLRAALCWLPTLIPQVLLVVLMFYVMIPYVIGAYRIPTNNMAPTLFGPRQNGICPECGGQAISTYEPERDGPGGSAIGTCLSCQKSGRMTLRQVAVEDGDRFFVNKLAKPVRWDVITFRTVANESVISCNRLIGLPGEEVFISDGAIWINGVRQTPLPELAKLKWNSPFAEGVQPEPKDPSTKLGDNEYFVLGDFSEQSYDSRYWGPLPVRNLDGVVEIIYWPLSRFRLLK